MRSHAKAAVFGMSSLALLVGAGCQSATPASWDASGRPVFTYDSERMAGETYRLMMYHPSAQAYADPYTHRSYWFEDGVWWSGDFLPRYLFDDIEVEQHAASVVRVRGDMPMFQHDAFAAANPARRDQPWHLNPFTYFHHVEEGAAPEHVVSVSVDEASPESSQE
jgi:hypothetical protein